MNVLITGTGREQALGFNFVRRYLENGDRVFATVRKPSEALNHLQEQYAQQLTVLEMDIASTSSVENVKNKIQEQAECLDLIINNAVATSPDCYKELEDADLDYIAPMVNIGAVGPLRVVKAFLPMLKKSAMTALIVNISSEAGSIGRCYRTNMIDYGMTKAALNMATMNLYNKFKDEPKLNVICIHPGWMRTNDGNAKAPNDPYMSAETMRLLFEKKREDKDGPRFVTFEGETYPW